jgi:hypothetical protein
VGASAGLRTSLEIHCITYGDEQTRVHNIPHIFLPGSLIGIATKVHATTNYFEIIFKLSWKLPHRLLFMNGSFLAPALKLYYFLLL